MIKVSSEELSKIAQFLSSCDDMINGKFILADIKITKVLNMIADSEELYRYISECLTSYDFARELHRAEVKNGLNGGVFAVPTEESKLVAFVFCLLVECDSKRIDFYTFINENFKNGTNAYQEFSQKLLVPFKNIIANRFGMFDQNEAQVEELTNQYRDDLAKEPIFENYSGQTNYENPSFANLNANGFAENSIFASQQTGYYNQNAAYDSQIQNESTEQFFQNNQNVANGYVNFDGMPAQFVRDSQISNTQKTEPKEAQKDDWEDIKNICTNIESSIYAERKLKPYLKDELLYIISTIKYATKYKDVKIISALITAFDEMSKKYHSIQFVFGELKNKMEKLYK